MRVHDTFRVPQKTSIFRAAICKTPNAEPVGLREVDWLGRLNSKPQKFKTKERVTTMKTTTNLLLLGAWLLLSQQGAVAEPLFETKDVFIAGLDNVCEYRIPTLVTTGQGTLIAICDARVEKPGDAINNIDLALKRSLDHGRTWDRMQVIADFPGQNAACDASVLVDDKTDTVWVLYDYIVDEPAQFVQRPRETRNVELHLIQSHDDGQSWSPPRTILPTNQAGSWLALCAAPGRGIQTSDSQLIFPCYTRREKHDHSHLLTSGDGGDTWQLTSDAGPKVNECQVVELLDGSFILNMRSLRGNGCRAVARTEDAGENWQQMVDDSGLPEPMCQASFIRYTDQRAGFGKNRLLFSNPANASQRSNFIIRMSYDEGQTWPVSKVLNTGPSAYSCLTVLKDGTIGVLYENGVSNPYEKLTFVRFNLEWLTEGRDRLVQGN
jgi:sialidase-1